MRFWIFMITLFAACTRQNSNRFDEKIDDTNIFQKYYCQFDTFSCTIQSNLQTVFQSPDKSITINSIRNQDKDIATRHFIKIDGQTTPIRDFTNNFLSKFSIRNIYQERNTNSIFLDINEAGCINCDLYLVLFYDQEKKLNSFVFEPFADLDSSLFYINNNLFCAFKPDDIYNQFSKDGLFTMNMISILNKSDEFHDTISLIKKYSLLRIDSNSFFRFVERVQNL